MKDIPQQQTSHVGSLILAQSKRIIKSKTGARHIRSFPIKNLALKYQCPNILVEYCINDVTN